MKKIGIILASLALAASVFGQGQIQFQNRVTAAGLFAPIYGANSSDPFLTRQGNATTNGGSVDYTGHPLLAGTGFTAELMGNQTSITDPSLFISLGTAPFQTATTLRGIIRGPTTAPVVPWVPGPANGSGNFQIRAWDNVGGTITSWAMVLANPNVARGASDVLMNVPVIAAPNTPGALVGLTSFSIAPVPEPSLIALGALGLGALLLRRMRKQS